jgi:hypothetical protein
VIFGLYEGNDGPGPMVCLSHVPLHGLSIRHIPCQTYRVGFSSSLKAI